MSEAVMRSVQPGDLEALCDNLRAADLAEVTASGEPTGAAGVRYSVGESDVVWTLEFAGQVGAMGGFKATMDGRLMAWMLTTEAFGARPRPFIRALRKHVPWLRTFGELFNFIDGRYTGALRLVASLGATFGSPIDRNGHAFVPFCFGRL